MEEVPQIYSIDEGKFVPMPVAEKPTDKPEDKEKEKDKEVEEPEIEQPENKPDPEEQPDPEKLKEEPAKEDEVVTPDDFIKASYEEKYGIKSQAELNTTIEKALELMDDFEILKKENTSLKEAKPKFASDKEEKAYDFIKKFDINRQGEGLHTFAKLISMDVENTDGKLLLEEQYVHKHPQWTREEAQRMFAKEHNKKYALNRDSFETEAAYEEELRDMKTLEKGEIYEAKQYLKEQQEKYKPKVEEAKTLPAEVKQSIEKHTKEFGDFAKNTNELVFEKDGSKFIFKLDDKKKADIESAMLSWVKNPTSYNEKGQILGVKDAKEMHSQVIGALFMKDLVDVLYDQVKNDVSKKRVEEIGKVVPKKRTSPGAGDTNKKDDLYDGAIQLIKKKQAA